MPLYEFRCVGCETEYELLVRNGENPACPECGSGQAEKLLSAPAVRAALAVTGACPPPESGPCGPGCCRLPG